MEIYLVGGAVRDSLLQRPIKERDWVVVGATPEALEAKGFKAVGQHFPVFLHPDTHEEYALARTERKVARGYKGFDFYSAPDVTLEQDLKRRDLTINAIAEDSEGHLIDPYHGQRDLMQRRLRHVSDAFAEDPVRILRIARFAAKLPHFSVDPETNTLMQRMVASGEVDALVAERVWQEWRRAMQETAPLRFFEVLADCNALANLFPEIAAAQESCYQRLALACRTLPDEASRFAILLSPLDELAAQALCQRYKLPNEVKDLVLLTTRLKNTFMTLDTEDANALLGFVLSADALRKPARLEQLLAIFDILTEDQSKSGLIRKIVDHIQTLDLTPLQAKQLSGESFKKALNHARIELIQRLIDSN